MQYNMERSIMQKHIFNEYDIRWILGQDINYEDIDQLTHAIIAFYESKLQLVESIAVAMDARLNSSDIFQRVSQVLIARGIKVYKLGVCSLSLFSFGLHYLPVQAGIMITGSYLSKEYNGFKLYLGVDQVWGKELQEVYSYIGSYVPKLKKSPGKIIPTPIVDQYVESLWQEFKYLSEYDFSLVIDCGHTVVAPVIKKLVAKMGWKKVVTICDDVNGKFPNHDPYPVRLKNMDALQQKLLQDNIEVGFAFDGDASRIIGLTHNKEMILGDQLLGLFVHDYIATHSSLDVVHDGGSSSIVKDMNQDENIKVHLVESGPIAIQQKMKDTGALLGGDVYGNCFFRDRHFGSSDGLYTIMRLLELVVKTKLSVVQLLNQLPTCYRLNEVRIPCTRDKKNEFFQNLGSAIQSNKKWKMSQLDGIRIESDQGWSFVRASTTEPVVSIRCGAKSEAALREMKKDMYELLKDYLAANALKNYFD